MKELADDYRRSGKLLEFRSNQGVSKVREQLSKMQKEFKIRQAEVDKAKKNGYVVD